MADRDGAGFRLIRSRRDRYAPARQVPAAEIWGTAGGDRYSVAVELIRVPEVSFGKLYRSRPIE